MNLIASMGRIGKQTLNIAHRRSIEAVGIRKTLICKENWFIKSRTFTSQSHRLGNGLNKTMFATFRAVMKHADVKNR